MRLLLEGVEVRLIAASDTDYGIHEGASLDADTNLIRFESPIS